MSLVPQPLNELTSNLTFVVENENATAEGRGVKIRRTTEGRGVNISATLSQLTAAEFISVLVTHSVPDITVIDSEIF